MAKYTCAMCGEVFDKIIPDEEALVELYEQFGEDVSVDECVIVCDDCWQKVKPDQNKEMFEEWQVNRKIRNNKQGGNQ